MRKNLAKGFIHEFKFPQAATLFFVSKKDGKTRSVQDYQYLNDWTVKNAYLLPQIDDLIDRLIGKNLSKWMSNGNMITLGFTKKTNEKLHSFANMGSTNPWLCSLD